MIRHKQKKTFLKVIRISERNIPFGALIAIISVAKRRSLEAFKSEKKNVSRKLHHEMLVRKNLIEILTPLKARIVRVWWNDIFIVELIYEYDVVSYFHS